jgi:cytochrome P450
LTNERATGEAHKRLRAAMNVGFSAAAVRSYQSVFTRVAHKVILVQVYQF